MEYLISQFKLHFPSFAMRAVRYEADAYRSEWLIVFLDNGDRLLFDSYQHTIRNLPRVSECMTEDETRYEFGRRLEKIMMSKGVTQLALSEATGIKQSTISDYINYKHTPSFYAADKIAKALGCSIDEFRCL